jgi:hypothetical protein
MVRRNPKSSKDEHAVRLSRSGGRSAQGNNLPGSQGTDSVRGTWSSEGEAGHHLGSSAAARPKTPSRTSPRQRLERIATQAREYPDMAFTTLAHHLDVPFLERAFDRLNRRSAPGIDRVTWQAYEENLIPGETSQPVVRTATGRPTMDSQKQRKAPTFRTSRPGRQDRSACRCRPVGKHL